MKIEIPKTSDSFGGGIILTRSDWYDLINAIEDHNKMLSKGVEVKATRYDQTGNVRFTNGTSGWVAEEHQIEANDRTHTALLINIQPIKKETAEDVLSALAGVYKSGQLGNKSKEIIERAKAVLD